MLGIMVGLIHWKILSKHKVLHQCDLVAYLAVNVFSELQFIYLSEGIYCSGMLLHLITFKFGTVRLDDFFVTLMSHNVLMLFVCLYYINAVEFISGCQTFYTYRFPMTCMSLLVTHIDK